jgi:hypothetical protein
MKSYADKICLERQFNVGEQVLLKLQPYVQQSVVNRSYPKLSYKYFGPYHIMEKIGPVAYKLELPETAQVHIVFHVSQLKPFTANYSPFCSDCPTAPDLAATTPLPATILQLRLVRKSNAAVQLALIQWAHLPADQATWEDYYVVIAKYPNASLWEEEAEDAQPQGGSSMRVSAIELVYNESPGHQEMDQARSKIHMAVSNFCL